MKLELIKYSAESKLTQTPLLFVHGVNHDARCWSENFLPFFSSRGFDSYALSFRGHGRSPGLEKLQSFSLGHYTTDLLGVLEEFASPPVLIGHSMGGAVVQKVMQMTPEKIKGAVLLSSVPPGGLGADFIRLIFTRFSWIISGLLFDMGKKVKFPMGLFLPLSLAPGKCEKYRILMQRESVRVKRECFRPVVSRGAAVSLPLLIMGGEKDLMVSPGSARKTGAFYGKEVVLLRECCHDQMLDPHWMDSAEMIYSFLKKTILM